MDKTQSDPLAKASDTAPAPHTSGRAPLTNLRREIDRLFDDFDPVGWFSGTARRPRMPDVQWPWNGHAMMAPAMDMVETGTGYRITAELPGLEASDITVRMTNHTLQIKGEKREESSTQEGDYHMSERRYGTFQRSIRLPDGIDADKIDSKFVNGVLTVNIPKTAEARVEEKHIEVKAG